MLTRNSFKSISTIYGSACFLKTVPFTWNSDLFQLEIVDGWSFKIYFLTALCTWTYLSFMIMRYVQYVQGNEDTGKMFNQFLQIVRFSLISILQWAALRRRLQVAIFINHMLHFNRKLERIFQDKSTVLKTDKCEIILKVMVIVGYLQVVIATIGFWRDPANNGRSYYSVIPENSRHWLLAIPFFIIYLVNSMIYWSVALFFLCIILAYGFSTTRCLREINPKTNSEYTIKLLRKKTVSFKAFRCIQIINTEFNTCFEQLPMPGLQLGILLMGILPLFMTIRLHSSIPFSAFMSVPLRATSSLALISTFFPNWADLHYLSLKYIGNAKHLPQLDRADKKFIKSCRPIRINCSFLFYVRKFTEFRVFGFILYYTMKLLLIFRT